MGEWLYSVLKVWKLSWGELLLLLLEAHLVILLRILLWLIPFRWLRRVFLGISRSGGGRPIARETKAWKIIWGIRVVNRYLPRLNNCLANALAAKILLKSLGYDVDLLIGVKLVSRGSIQAHAWLESEGRVVLGGLSDLGHYKPLSGLNHFHISDIG